MNKEMNKTYLDSSRSFKSLIEFPANSPHPPPLPQEKKKSSRSKKIEMIIPEILKYHS